MSESLTLKWGTLKGWYGVDREEVQTLLAKYFDIGVCMDVAMQRDTPEQKQILCDLIDIIDGEIRNDWDGVIMSKDDAKKYVMSFGKTKENHHG